ncbi:MAG TPA: hypothetical protein VJ461_03430 [Candidatus Nanoarchaeia archaeon]|nr:hypothetical protein [Candidatus Nanoarchaeia archaeon]
MRKRLHLKGWSKQEIAHAEKIFAEAEKKKHPHMRKLENSLYWFTLIIGLIGTVLLSVVLIPVLMISNNTWSYVLTGFFGFLLGALIIIIVKDLHWLEPHHHLSLSLIIPIAALFNFFIVVNRVNIINNSIGISNFHNPLFIGIIYFVCFTIPYVAFLMVRKRK